MIKIMKLDATYIYDSELTSTIINKVSLSSTTTPTSMKKQTPTHSMDESEKSSVLKKLHPVLFLELNKYLPWRIPSIPIWGHQVIMACANASDNVRGTRFFTIFTVLDIGMTCEFRCFGCGCVFFCWPPVNWRQDAKQQQKTPADMLGYTEILVLHSDSHWRSLLLVFNKTVSCCLPTVTQIVAKCFTNISLSDII